MLNSYYCRNLLLRADWYYCIYEFVVVFIIYEYNIQMNLYVYNTSYVCRRRRPSPTLIFIIQEMPLFVCSTAAQKHFTVAAEGSDDRPPLSACCLWSHRHIVREEMSLAFTDRYNTAAGCCAGRERCTTTSTGVYDMKYFAQHFVSIRSSYTTGGWHENVIP